MSNAHNANVPPSPLLSALRINIEYFIETTRIKLHIIRLTAPIHWNSVGGDFLLWNIVSKTYNGLVPLEYFLLFFYEENDCLNLHITKNNS